MKGRREDKGECDMGKDRRCGDMRENRRGARMGVEGERIYEHYKENNIEIWLSSFFNIQQPHLTVTIKEH